MNTNPKYPNTMPDPYTKASGKNPRPITKKTRSKKTRSKKKAGQEKKAPPPETQTQ